VNRYLDFFDPAVAATILRPLEGAYACGARKVLVVGTDNCNSELRSILSSAGFASFAESHISDVQAVDMSDSDLLVINSGSSTDVSRVLHACISKTVTVIAPITDHHSSNRTVFLMSIPKAGTHMVIRLLGLMGLQRSSDHAPRPGTWCTPIGYEYHAPCREFLENDWIKPLGRHLFFRSPAIFVYRHPLDIVVSELGWFVKAEHSFSGYLNCCADDRERLSRLIADDSVMGSIRDRINRYTGWMNFGNVIPVSYEELVGGAGGGDDIQQADSIWALQLKLHVSGDPEEFGRQLYDPGSATFANGRIGCHEERFADEHWTALDTLPQDFMRVLGYAKGSVTSSRVDEMLKRPLVVKQLSDEQLYTPKLVRSDYLGWNIVEIAGRYFPVKQGQQIASLEESMAFYHDHDGFMTITEVREFLVHDIASRSVQVEPSQFSGTVLLVEGYLDFNIVYHNQCWYGFAQAMGPLDIASLDAQAINVMKSNRQCVSGENVADVKTEILRQAVQEQLGRLKKQHKPAVAHSAKTEQRLDELGAYIDAAQLRSGTALQSVQEQLGSLKEQHESVVAHSAETEQRLDELGAYIDEAQLRSGTALQSVQEQLGSLKEQHESVVAHSAETEQRLDELWAHINEAHLRSDIELQSVQEQLGRIVNNPLKRMGRLMYRELRTVYYRVFRVER
jgi:hypothetical protein